MLFLQQSTQNSTTEGDEVDDLQLDIVCLHLPPDLLDQSPVHPYPAAKRLALGDSSRIAFRFNLAKTMRWFSARVYQTGL
ncbi:hypothetical protein PtB15_16B378 [Puccinia triticina]|nr:hypothetical protein PtB15_16B378 [Puccinia triticina]